jgi:hypothetical protein
MPVDEERDIRLRRNKAKAVGEVGESLVPCPWSLLQTIERLVKMAHIVGAARIDEPWWLLTIDLLVKCAMEKGILDIKLVNRP